VDSGVSLLEIEPFNKRFTTISSRWTIEREHVAITLRIKGSIDIPEKRYKYLIIEGFMLLA